MFSRRLLRFWFLLIFLCFCWLDASSQSIATITFSFDFPGADPAHYTISVASDGNTTYHSDGKLSEQEEAADPFQFSFKISDGTVRHIFDLAARAHHFDGNLDSGKKKLASTGIKTLEYKDAQKSTHAVYNYSPNPAVLELTGIFQNLSSTLEYGRRLQYFHRFQKLALDNELKEMESMSKEKNLEELSVVAPILREIVDDPTVLNVVRARAQRLLAVAAQK